MGKKKSELLRECAKILERPKVSLWYEKKLHGKSQYETINILEVGISKGELSIREALSILLIVGVQWDVKFEGGEKYG